MKPRYGVARMFKKKRDAEKFAKRARDDHFGARVSKTLGGYMVRRTDYRIN